MLYWGILPLQKHPAHTSDLSLEHFKTEEERKNQILFRKPAIWDNHIFCIFTLLEKLCGNLGNSPNLMSVDTSVFLFIWANNYTLNNLTKQAYFGIKLPQTFLFWWDKCNLEYLLLCRWSSLMGYRITNSFNEFPLAFHLSKIQINILL